MAFTKQVRLYADDENLVAHVQKLEKRLHKQHEVPFWITEERTTAATLHAALLHYRDWLKSQVEK